MSNSLLSDAVFWISLATIVISAYKFTLSELYKSKCSKFKCCFNLLNVERNVIEEAKIDIENIHQAHQEQDNKKKDNVIIEEKNEL